MIHENDSPTPVDPRQAPEEMRELDQWVGWRRERRDGKLTKPPYRVDGEGKAACDKRATWSPFEEALEAVEAGRCHGVGFMFSSEDPFYGLDLDKCRDPATGELEPWALELVDSFNGAYIEASPSGAGVHIIAKGTGPGRRRGRIEAYKSRRFFTVTGDVIRGGPSMVIANQQPQIDALISKYLTDPEPEPNGHQAGPDPRGELGDEELLELARKARNGPKFSSLYDAGDISEYDDDDSRADCALLVLLAFYTRDPAQLERLFNGSALGRRGKWRNRPDYRRRTIARALERQTETYTGKRRKPEPGPEPGPEAEHGAEREANPLRSALFDVGAAMKGGIPPPDVHHEDLLIRGARHLIYGASGQGKSWVLLWLAKQALKRGERVLYLDAEMGHRVVTERLTALGVTADEASRRLLYLPFPELTMEARGDFEELLDAGEVDLVLFDAWAGFLGQAGLDENSNPDVEAWVTHFLVPVKAREITTVILDHIPHDATRERGAIRKREACEVSWQVVQTREFNRRQVGELTLKKRKDREAWLPELVKFSIGGTEAGEFLCEKSSGTIGADAAPRPGDTRRALVKTLREKFGDAGATNKELRAEFMLSHTVSESTFFRHLRALKELGVMTVKNDRYFLGDSSEYDDPPAGDSNPHSDHDSALFTHRNAGNGRGASGDSDSDSAGDSSGGVTLSPDSPYRGKR